MTTLAPSAQPAEPEQRFVLDGVDWDFYQVVRRRAGGRRVFVTYHKGRLELTSPSFIHEGAARALGLLVFILAEELGVQVQGCKSTTFARRDLDAGLEPDECFYTANAAAVRGLDQINLERDPPPDLAVEVEISRRLLGRVDIYRELGVPELWRYDGRRLLILLRGADGVYHPAERSPTFPALSPEQAHAFVALHRDTADEAAWAREVRAWVRQQLGSPPAAAPPVPPSPPAP
jgi:Uma2 family endonuclease